MAMRRGNDSRGDACHCSRKEEEKRLYRAAAVLPTGSRQKLEKQNADTSKRDRNFTLHQ